MHRQSWFNGPEVGVLQEWFEEYWDQAESVSPELLKTISRHTETQTPFEVFAQSLHHLFRDAPSPSAVWERMPAKQGGSVVFKLLDKYQQDG